MVTNATRAEKDALGEVRVDASRLWGAQTQRSIDNFPIGVARFGWGRPVIRAFGLIKQCAARANVDLGERRDAGANFGVGEAVGTGAGAGPVVRVDREQDDDDDRDGKTGNDRGNELCGGFDWGFVIIWCFAHACLVSRGYCERYSVTATTISLLATDDYRRKVSAAVRGVFATSSSG